MGTVFSAAGLGLLAWSWLFIHEDLSPLLAKTLTKELKRPVELGEVEQVTPYSVRLGPSKLGAAEQDTTTVSAESVVVKFDLIETALTSKLGLDLTVEGAEGYLEQDKEKGWLNVEIPKQEKKDRRFKVSLDDIHVRNSQITLVPLPFKPAQNSPAALPNAPRNPAIILIKDVGAQINFDEVTVAGEDTRNTRFEVTGNPEKGGEIGLKGDVQPVEAVPSSQEKIQYATNLTIRADKAPLSDILGFTLSSINQATDKVTVKSGKVSGTMDMAFRPPGYSQSSGQSSGKPSDKPSIEYSGVIGLDSAEVKTAILPLPLKALNGQTRFKNNQWTIDTLKGDYGAIALNTQGLIDFDNIDVGKGYDLALTSKDVTVKEFTETIELDLPVPTEGTFDAVANITGPILNPEFAGTATAVSALNVDKLTFTSASTDFRLQGQQLSLSNIAATPNTGGALRGSGQVLLSQGAPFRFDMAASSVPADEIAKLYGLNPGFKLGLVSAEAIVTNINERGDGSVTTTVDWDAPVAQYPGSGRMDINGDAIAFSNTQFQVGGGTATGSGNLISGQWQGDINLQQVQLNAFSDELRGDVSGQFKASGSTADFRVGAIAARGNVAFSDGLATFNPQFNSLSDPLTAQVVWNGQQIEVSQARTGRITANGTLTPIFDQGAGAGFDGLERLDLDVAAQDYEITEIPFITIPTGLNLAGRADFAGSIAGNPKSPTITGDVLSRDLVVNRLPFNSVLTGRVNYATSSGLALNLTGDTDKIALNVGPSAVGSTAPNLNFDIGWRDAFARGTTQGEQLRVQAGNFPLSALNFPPTGAADIGQVRGTLTAANLDINLNDQTLTGDIDVEQLGLGYIGAGRLVGQVRYANRLATLTSGELRLNDSLYTLSGKLALDGPVPVYSANLETQQGNVQNLLTALSIYELEDFRRGLTPPEWLKNPPSQAVLDDIFATSPTGSSEAVLAEQLRRLAEIQAIQTENKIAAKAQPLPPLQDLNGPFAGALQLNGSGSDFQLDFDLAGRNWQWGDNYSAQEVVAKGSLTPNVLTLEPVRFASVIPVAVGAAAIPAVTPALIPQPGAALSTAALEAEGAETANPEAAGLDVQPVIAAVNLAGQLVFGRNTQLTSNLQATAQNLNIDTLNKVLAIPVDIDGFANATASLGGTLANPQLRGAAALAAATINDTPIQSATTSFLYQNARLLLSSELIANTPEHPLTLSAQIPYAFNFMETRPDSEDIKIEVDVADEGLALLNIFTQQVAWQSGSGQVNLTVEGTRENPKISGTANLQDAVIQAQILPEPLTNVTGQAIFAGDQIIVQALQGSFSDGQLTAAGTFPLRKPIISGTQLSALSTTAATDESMAATEDPLFPQPLAANLPLTVNFENVDLTLKDLYRGGVNGQVIVGGSALLSGPQIGGQVILSQGQVQLRNSPEAASETASSDTNPAGLSTEELSADATSSGISPTTGGLITPNFRDLRLTLGRSVQIIRGSQLSFIADGTLVLNGPPTDLRPDGIIKLKSGSVNLFTTLFRLRGNNNTAKFTPENGLQNPYLNVALRAAVPEVSSAGPIVGAPFANAEVADTSNNGFSNPGSLRTIRVRADVNGPANALLENLELSSSPARSDTELIGLLSGGIITALESTVGSLSGDGDSFGGLINLVSGTILTRVQDLVGNALSLSEFNLFPVTAASRALPENSSENTDTGLDIGASIGFDVTESAALSVSKILTDSTNPEFGLSYRLTDALTVRGATNFDEINQFLLEYELRF